MHGNAPGAGTQGHQVIAAPYDGREVGPLIQRLRKTMRETSFMGMPIMAGADLAAFLSMTRSFKSLLHVSKRFCRHLVDLALHGRAMQLVNGVALVARLAKSADKLGVQLIDSAPAQAPDRRGRRGARRGGVDRPRRHRDSRRQGRGAGRRRLPQRRAAAQGAVPAHADRPRASSRCRRPAAPATASAWASRRAVAWSTDLASPVAWAPVSLVPHADGSVGHFPHIIDRAKPGVIGVLANGKRFVNEADGYYDYTAAMVAAVPEGEEVASWLICDHRFQRRYGLGYARPFPLPVGPVRAQRLPEARRLDRGTGEALRHRPGCAGGNRAGSITSMRGAARIRIRPRFDAVQPQAGRSAARRPQPLRRADRARPFLRREGAARQLSAPSPV